MAITNGYCTLAEYKSYARITTANAGDDTVIEDLVEAASRYIDNETGRTFYSRAAETRYFDCPRDRTLWLDDDLVSIDVGGLINGDTVAIATTEYNFLPKNRTPKFAVRLKKTSNIVWEPDSDLEFEGVISIKGTWGYSATAPDEIKLACMMIARAMYARRTGENVSMTSLATAAGVMIMPEGIPADASRIIQAYRRFVWA